jgi:hypothetical protein
MIEKTIMDAINSLVADRVFFDAVPQDTLLPYLTLQQVGGSPVGYLDGTDSQDLVRIQIDVFAGNRTQANALMEAVRVILAADPFNAAAVGSPVSGYESSVQIFRRSCDFMVLTDR